MAKISGILTDGAGQVINDCTIELYAKKTTSKVLTQTQAFKVANNGCYTMNVLPCEYDVSLIINGFPKKRLGTIQVFSDSLDGTLNDFLLNPSESEITPPVLQQVVEERKNAQKAANEARNSASTLVIPMGDHRLFPFRANELPFGWYFRNGDNYLLNSPQGQALNSLSANYKNDHRITIKDINGQPYINVPNAFSPDGRGLFERPVNGITRQVGHIEDDKIRNITGGFSMDGIAGATAGVVWGGYGPFYENGANNSIVKYTPSEIGVGAKMGFDLSRATPHTGPETTVINEGKTPAIYLGV